MNPVHFVPEQLFELIGNSQTEVVQVLDRSGKTVYMNEAGRQRRIACGLTSDDDVSILIHPDDRGVVFAKLDAVLNHDEDLAEVRARFMHGDGQYFGFLARAKRMYVESEWTGLVLVTGANIDSQVQAEQRALAAERESENRFRTLFDESPDASFICSLDDRPRIIACNLAAQRMLRGSADQIVGKSTLDFAPAEQPDGTPTSQLIAPDLARFRAQTQSAVEFEQVRRRCDGGNFWANISVARINFGNELRALVVWRDVSERKAAEAALTESEAKFRLITDNQTDYIQLVDCAGNVLFDSPSLLRLRNEAQLQRRQLGASASTLIHPDDRQRVVDLFAQIVATGKLISTETRWVFPSGETRWIEAKGVPIMNADGQVDKVLTVNRDITERKQVELALAESEATYRMLADNSSDYVQLFSLDGRVLYESPSMVRLLGEHYVRGRRLVQGPTLVHPDDQELVRKVFSKLVQGGEDQRLDYRWLLFSGETRWVETQVRGIKNDRGEMQSVISVIRDITDRKLAEQQREEALEKARIANEAKSQFLAKVSHELRTPLNAVTGYGFLLKQSQLDLQQAANVEQILASSRHLLGLISDVLDLSRIEAGQQTVNPAVFSLKGLLEDTLNVVRPAAEARGIDLLLDDTGFLPDRLLGDAGLIKQALLNYLSNAVKFTEHGQVRLQVRALAEVPGHLRFDVHDTGAGIPADWLGELFQPFSQLKADTRGTGLGLDITRRIVELMGGEVGVQSKLGQGSCFWFSIPVQPVQNHMPTVGAQESSTGQAVEMHSLPLVMQALRKRHAGKVILVADDDTINQGLMRLLLGKVGLEADIAVDGHNAVEKAGLAHYPLVLMDLQMPQMNGIDATQAIRRLPGWQQLPIVALTADVFTDTREACLAAGMTDFLGKPVDADKLFSLLLSLLDAG